MRAKCWSYFVLNFFENKLRTVRSVEMFFQYTKTSYQFSNFYVNAFLKFS